MIENGIGRNHETIINHRIAALLGGERGWTARAEQNRVVVGRPASRPDVVVGTGAGSAVIIETEFEPAATIDADAERAAEFVLRKYGPPAAVVGIAVPTQAAAAQGDDRIDAILTASNSLQYFVLIPGAPRFPRTGYLRGSLHDIRNAVRMSSVSAERVKAGYDETVSGMERIVEHLRGQRGRVHESIRRTLKQPPREGSPAKKGAGRAKKRRTGQEQPDDYTHPYTLNMAALVMINAAVFQSVLSGRRDDVPQIPAVSGLHPPTKETFVGAWTSIRAIDYAPVFDGAIEILEAIPTEPASTIATILATTADRVVSAGAHRFGDLLGMLYQKQLFDRKRIAAYYTLPEAAALLAGITMGDGRGGWSDPEWIQGLKVADFACGSGSLLQAAYAHMIACSARGLAERHSAIMARCLYGYDIYPTATHFTVSALSYIYHDVAFDACRIYTLPFGASGDRVDLGSLDLLGQSAVFDGAGRRQGGQGERDVDEATVQRRSCDYIVMNPPYSGTTDHGDHSTDTAAPFAAFGLADDQQKAMAKKNNRMYRNTCSDGNAGLASHFFAICNEKIRPGGRIGLVLPGTVLSGDAWKKVRAVVNEWYDDVVVLAVGDGSLSADTHMHEVMLAATRRKSARAQWREDIAALRIKFVELDRLPESILEARELAKYVMDHRALRAENGAGPSYVLTGNDRRGRMLDCPSVSRIEADGAAGALRPASATGARARQRNGNFAPSWPYRRATRMSMWYFAYCLAHNIPLPDPPAAARLGAGTGQATIPITTLSRLGRIGLVHRDIVGDEAGKKGTPRGPFTNEPYREDHPRPCLWNNDSKSQRRMMVSPDGVLVQRPNALDDHAKRVMDTASHLHFNNEARYTSQRLIAAYTADKTVGGRAWPNVILGRAGHEKPLAAWCNSTLGMLLYWISTGEQHRGRGMTGVTALEQAFPVLNLRAVGAARTRRLARLFDRQCREEMLPLNQARKDPVRKAIDDRILEILDVDLDMGTVYRWVSAERQFHDADTRIH